MMKRCTTAIAITFLATAALAETITVDDDGLADFVEIQDAIEYAIDGDLILVEPGVYSAAGEHVVDLLGKAITLRSVEGAGVTIIDGEGERRGIICRSGENQQSVIEGFTIRDCSATWHDWNGNGQVDSWEYFGGGMWCRDGSSPTIRGCRFVQNMAEYGCGLYNGDENGVASNPILEDCVFEGNITKNGVGGGMYNYSSSPTLVGCSFIGNGAYFGGGILNWDGSNCSITSCLFDVNSAHDGGGIYNDSSMPILVECTFTGNSATDGAGMFNADPGSSVNVPVLQRCIFKGNSASGEGGGMHNFSISPELTECTISGNNAGSGGGVYSWNSSVPFFHDSLVCGNSPDQVSGSYAENEGNMIADSCPDDCYGDLTGDGLVDGADLTVILGNWGTCPDPADCLPDITGDGIVDGADITVVLAYWEQCR